MQVQDLSLFQEDGKWIYEVEADNQAVSHNIKGPAGRVCVQLGEFCIGKLRGEVEFNDKNNAGELLFSSDSLTKGIVIQVGIKKHSGENLIPIIKESVWIVK